RTQPAERLQVVRVRAELADLAGRAVGVRSARDGGLLAGPRVLHAGVERAPREVQPDARSVGSEGLRLQPGQDAQGLRVALEAAAVLRGLVQRALAVVPERWVP